MVRRPEEVVAPLLLAYCQGTIDILVEVAHNWFVDALQPLVDRA